MSLTLVGLLIVAHLRTIHDLLALPGLLFLPVLWPQYFPDTVFHYLLAAAVTDVPEDSPVPSDPVTLWNKTYTRKNTV